MAGRIILGIANPALDANGKVDAGATLTFYQNLTTTPQSIYADFGLSTPLTNPLACDAAGRFPEIWAPTGNVYSVKWTPTGASPITYDYIIPTSASSGPLYGPVGIGMTPVEFLDITDSFNGNAVAQLLNANSGPNASAQFRCVNDATNRVGMIILGSGFTTNGIFVANTSLLYTTAGQLGICSQNGPIQFASNGINAQMALLNGKLGIGTLAPTSALQVVGIPVFANNAAAIAGGLTAGAFYRTGADPDPVCVVH